jgi:hypothetical protein
MGKKRSEELKNTKWRKVRAKFLRNQKGDLSCFYCAEPLSRDKATVDHIVPIATGGDAYSHQNLATCCFMCNTLKGKMSEKAFRNKISKKTWYQDQKNKIEGRRELQALDPKTMFLQENYNEEEKTFIDSEYAEGPSISVYFQATKLKVVFGKQVSSANKKKVKKHILKSEIPKSINKNVSGRIYVTRDLMVLSLTLFSYKKLKTYGFLKNNYTFEFKNSKNNFTSFLSEEYSKDLKSLKDSWWTRFLNTFNLEKEVAYGS